MLHASWLASSNSSKPGLAERIARLYVSGLTGMSSKLADSLITFDMPSLVAASGILWQVCNCNCLHTLELEDTVLLTQMLASSCDSISYAHKLFLQNPF
jgi:hypothetical protein